MLTAREAVSWFSARRAVDLQGADVEADRLQAFAERGPETAASPALILRIHANPAGRDQSGASGSVDIPVDAHSLSALLLRCGRRPAERAGRLGMGEPPSIDVGALVLAVAAFRCRKLLR